MTDDTADCIVVLVAVGSHAEADRIADAVVAERWAACVNVVGPMRSVYRWKDQVQRDEELLLLIKTRAALFDALAARIRALHAYETPEIIALPITAGSTAYLRWLRGATRDAAG
jgi:periplasmic divalent cation tolerance protein